MEKTAFYLSHEEERLRIAMNGYIKIRDNFSYIHQLEHMIQTVEKNPF